jgi:hypothetical protein
MKSIGIVIVATNSYFILGLRFIKRFMHFYKGDCKVTFYFFSDEDPRPYTTLDNIVFIHKTDNSWVNATNSKFTSIVNIADRLKEMDYVYYFDADTDVDKPFTEEWFLGDMVGGEHFGNRSFLSNGKGFDRTPKSQAYVPLDSKLPYTYYYGAFFGGLTEKVLQFCETLINWQITDKKIKYEPGANDESYIQKYFHYNPPTLTVSLEKFAFVISDKGGIQDMRRPAKDISNLKKQALWNKEKVFTIRHGKIAFDE